MHKQKALRLYLFVNISSIVFMIFIIAWILRLPQIGAISRENYWFIVIPYIIIVNVLNGHAKKVGKGMLNPTRTNRKAIILRYVGLALFFMGILLGIFVQHNLIYIALAAIPVDILKVYFAHNGQEVEEETDVLDDFEIE